MRVALPFAFNSNLIQKAYLVCLLLVCLSIFLPLKQATNIAIALLSLTWLAEGNFKAKLTMIKTNQVGIASVALFLLYIGGMLYSENQQAGFKYLETKASLLIFPLVLSTATIKKESLYKSLFSFSWICAIFCLVAFLYQIKVVLDRADVNYLFSDGLVLIYKKQAVYFSIYVAFAILVFLNRLWFDNAPLSRKEKIALISATGFLLLMLFLLTSRTALFTLILIIFTTVLVLGVTKGKVKHAAVVLGGMIVLFSTLSFFFPQVILRFNSLRHYSFDFQNRSGEYHFAFENSEESWNGLNLRLAKWVCALDLIKQSPLLGVGTGDIKDDLVEAYLNRKFYYAAEKRYDPHNQYLETMVGLGVAGLLLLCLFYFYPLYLAIKKKNWLFAAFVVLVAFCSLTESVLSSSQGIIFICFFLFIFIKLAETNAPTGTERITMV